jgi:hypothetical protein
MTAVHEKHIETIYIGLMRIPLKLVTLVLFFSWSCNPIQTSYDQKADFSAYKTFCWLQGCEFSVTGPKYLNDSVVQARIKNTIIGNLLQKGLRYDDNNPDLLIDFHVTVESERAIIYHNREDEQYYYRFSYLQPEEVMLTKGTILIHVVDRARSEVVWQSYAAGYLDPVPDLSEKNIRKGIDRVMKKFPPGR